MRILAFLKEIISNMIYVSCFFLTYFSPFKFVSHVFIHYRSVCGGVCQGDPVEVNCLSFSTM